MMATGDDKAIPAIIDLFRLILHEVFVDAKTILLFH
jgi:hypothetical protein